MLVLASFTTKIYQKSKKNKSYKLYKLVSETNHHDYWYK